VPHDRGLAGHSDADVLLHAICDALLGAAAMGDIGAMFPDSDPRYAGISSRRLLGQVVERLAAAGYSVVNVDATVVAQVPRLAPYIGAMREVIATEIGVGPGRVNVKATTTERMGFTGREEGIADSATWCGRPFGALQADVGGAFAAVGGHRRAVGEYQRVIPKQGPGHLPEHRVFRRP